MEAKHIERLEQVVRVLRELPKEKRFDINTWNICGTVGCAVGWAASDPWFRRRGFVLKMRRKLPANVARTFGVAEGAASYFPTFKWRTEESAIATFFGLGQNESHHLFYNSAYARGSKSDVIRRLESFIKKKRKELGLKAAA